MTALGNRSRSSGRTPSRTAPWKLFLLLLVAGLLLIPGWLIVVMSVSSETQIVTPPPDFLPSPLSTAAYPAAVDVMHVGRAFFNSCVVAFSATAVNVVLSGLAGYAFARVPFPGRNILFLLFLVTLMIPIQLVMVPLYLMLSHVPFVGGNDGMGQGGAGLLNSYPALVFPVMVRAVDVFLFRQYFRSLPREYGEQAKVDGCTELGVFRRIYLPLAQPIVVTVALLSFIAVWNDLVWPLVTTSSTDMQTMQVALLGYRTTEHARLWSVLMAGNVMCFVLPVILYLLFQRYIVKGIGLGGLKG